MRRPPYHHDRGSRFELKMTSMIDVIFLLLIFFVYSASFRAAEEVLPTRFSLPGSVDAVAEIDPEVEDLDPIVVKILAGEAKVRWQINDVDYSQLAEVRAVLTTVKRVQADLPVILDVEPAVPMDNVIDVYDLCRLVGLERIQFAASVGE